MSETTLAPEVSAESTRPRRHLRWLLPLGFLLLTAWLLWQKIDEFDLIELQRTLLAVPTLPMLGVALLALAAVGITGLVDVLDDSIRIEVTLPWLLGKIAEKLIPAIRREGTLMLEKK